jgi:hypothetical protein
MATLRKYRVLPLVQERYNETALNEVALSGVWLYYANSTT